MKIAIKLTFIMLTILLFAHCRSKNIDYKDISIYPTGEDSTIIVNKNTWVFILAGQSNMAGRANIMAIDTIPNPRILTIDKTGNIIVAKEPIHYYEPTFAGLDCGLAFGNELLNHIPDSISILILPTAVGGTSIKQWIQNATFRNVTLFSNFKEKVIIGKSHGVIKGILWHQGENDALNKETIDIYDKQLQTLFSMFRNEIGNNRLPIIIGELGTFSDNDDGWQKINEKIKVYIKTDSNAHLISTSDLKDKGDKIHFDSESQRKLGKRFAEEFNQIRN
jgi:hypothetical protein